MGLMRRTLVYCLLSAMLLLGGCGDEEKPTDVVIPPQEPTAIATTIPAREIQSPLSPISTPQISLASRQFARPDRPYLLFFSSRDKPGCYLHDLGEGTETWAAFQDIPGFSVRNAIWLPELQAFVLQMVDSRNQTDLFLVDLAGEIVAQITADLIEEGDASFAQDAGEFVFVCVQNDLDICKSRLGGAQWTNLTNIRTREASPAWSPDGQQILFLSDAAGITNIWLMGADGSNRRNLSGMTLGTDLVEESNPSWSPDGTSILFQSMRDRNLEIYTIGPDGDSLRNLTQNPSVDMNPVWSPSGEMVAFQSDRENGQDVYVLDLANGGLVNISDSPDERENNFIWSSDGDQLYFDSNEGENYNIYVVNRDGTGKRLLIDNPADDVDPQWISP